MVAASMCWEDGDWEPQDVGSEAAGTVPLGLHVCEMAVRAIKRSQGCEAAEPRAGGRMARCARSVAALLLGMRFL